MIRPPPRSTLFPSTPLFRSQAAVAEADRSDPNWRLVDLENERALVPAEENSALQVLKACALIPRPWPSPPEEPDLLDRKSTRLNSSHGYISYAVFCLKKKKI